MLNSRDIALLISANCKKVKVYKKPKVSIIATGDELIYYQMKKKLEIFLLRHYTCLENLINYHFRMRL